MYLIIIIILIISLDMKWKQNVMCVLNYMEVKKTNL